MAHHAGPQSRAMTIQASHRHLDADTLAKLAGLQLRLQTVVEGTLAGIHSSPICAGYPVAVRPPGMAGGMNTARLYLPPSLLRA